VALVKKLFDNNPLGQGQKFYQEQVKRARLARS
jgi:hypothetical protein